MPQLLTVKHNLPSVRVEGPPVICVLEAGFRQQQADSGCVSPKGRYGGLAESGIKDDFRCEIFAVDWVLAPADTDTWYKYRV